MASAPWWEWLISPGAAATQDAPSAVQNWAKSEGAQIGSGLESGFIALLKDLWGAIRSYVYMSVGASIIILALIWYFSGKIITPQVAMTALMAM